METQEIPASVEKTIRAIATYTDYSGDIKNGTAKIIKKRSPASVDANGNVTWKIELFNDNEEVVSTSFIH